MLKEKLTVLTKSITTLNESFKNDRLMKLMRIKKQCEDVSMPLGCMGLENGSHKEKVECVLEEENMEVSLTPLEPQFVCVDTQDKGLVRDEPELEVGVEKYKSLKVSFLRETRRGSAAVGMLLCHCESCVKEFQDQRLDKLLGCRGGHNVATVYDGEQLGLVVGKGVQNACIPPCLKASNLLGCANLCLNLNMTVLNGKTYNILTPHFHCSMLVRLMVGLIGVIVDSSLFVGRNDVSCLSSHKKFDVEICCDSMIVDGCFDLNCLSIIERRVRLLWADIVVMIIPTWESIGEVKMEQRKISYFIFQTRFFENDVGFKCSEFYLGWCTLKWSLKSVVMLCMGEAGECAVPIMYRDLFESNNSGKGECSCHMTAEMQQWGCYGVLFKVLHIGNPPMKGIDHRYNNMIRLNDEIRSDSKPSQMQSEATQSIGKWFHIAELDVKAKKEVARAMCAYSIIGSEELIIEMSIPLVSNNQPLKLDAKNFEKNLMDYFLKNSDRNELKHTTDVGVAGLTFGDLNLKSPIWRAEDSGEGIECKVLCPFHYGKINCKMKILQSNSNKIPLMQLITGIMSIDAKETELAMILKWELKIMPIFEFKIDWIGIINTEGVAARASSDKTTKDVFEWMIAWEGQDSAEFIR